MLKTGEADIGYLMIGDEAHAIKGDPRLRLAQVISAATWWLDFPEQWDPKSPWHDPRVRLAANLAIDKQAINEVERMGPRHALAFTDAVMSDIERARLRLIPQESSEAPGSPTLLP